MTYAISTIVGDDTEDVWTLDRLKDNRIRTSARLLEQAKGPKGRKALSEKTGSTESEILDMANAADLMRIKGIGRRYIALLRAAEVFTVRDLRWRNPGNLHMAMARANQQHAIVDFLPPEKLVCRWVEQAKLLPLVIVYK